MLGEAPLASPPPSPTQAFCSAGQPPARHASAPHLSCPHPLLSVAHVARRPSAFTPVHEHRSRKQVKSILCRLGRGPRLSSITAAAF